MKATLMRRAAVATVLAVAATIGVTSASTAALDGDDFDAGNIISDREFFDGNGMTAKEVQSFLNALVPECVATYTCLKDYKQNTPTIAADRYCDGYQGGSRESAATILAKVGKSCNISQQTLLVLLQKEQGLVTHVWPSNWRYEKATGFGCPDTAGCDDQYGGFIYQMYYAARQYQVYAAWPQYYRHRAGQVNDIYWQAPRSIDGKWVHTCGSGKVYIENQATAGLYNYTPYQPNKAALDNLYGEGDSCSAYGNRNFWRIYNDWFGSHTSIGEVVMSKYWRDEGGADGWLGDSRSAILKPLTNSTGLVQEFEGGALVWTPSKVLVPMSSDAYALWVKRGGAGGDLGWPTSKRWSSSSAGGGTKIDFGKAALYDSEVGGAWVVSAKMKKVLAASGGINGQLGWPAGPQTTDRKTGIIRQEFQSRLVLIDGATVHKIPGKLASAYADMGEFRGALGVPDGKTIRTSYHGGGVAQKFEAGWLTTSAKGGDQVVLQGFDESWEKLGGVKGKLGWPVGAKYWDSAAGMNAQKFSLGVLWRSGGDSGYVHNKMIASVDKYGGVGALGLPTSNTVRTSMNGGGFFIQFADAWVTKSNVHGSYRVANRLADAYEDLGGPKGALGFPVADSVRDETTGLFRQDFANGSVFVTNSRSGWVGKHLLDEVSRQGGVTGSLGWPTSAPTVSGGVTSQQFGDVLLVGTANGEAGEVGTALQDAYGTLGSQQRGNLGVPVAAAQTLTRHGGGTIQEFSGGWLSDSANGGVQLVLRDFASAYAELDDARGVLGWPLSDKYFDDAAGLPAQRFSTSVLWVGDGRYGYVGNALVSAVNAFGGVGSDTLGWPAGNTIRTSVNGGGNFLRLDNAWVTKSDAGVQALVANRFAPAYDEYGGPKGSLGFPLGARVRDNVTGLFRQDFAKGSIYVTNSTYAWIPAQLRAQVNARGGVTGSLGWPIAEPVYSGGTVSLQFASETLSASV